MGFTYNAAPLPKGYAVGRFDPATDTPRHGRGHYVPTEEVDASTCRGSISWEAAMAEHAGKEPADVLVIGSGASGAIASMVLGQAGLDVVCLEQGGWTAPEDHPHISRDWEWQQQKRWNPNTNIRRGRDDFPVESNELEHPDVERGRRLDQRLHRALAALSAIGLPQGRRARSGARLADHLRGPRPLLRPGRTGSSA